MKFTMMSPTSSKAINVSWIEAQTNEGSFIIQEGHAPAIIILALNKELTMELENGTTTVMTISGGILEVTRNSATLIMTHE